MLDASPTLTLRPPDKIERWSFLTLIREFPIHKSLNSHKITICFPYFAAVCKIGDSEVPANRGLEGGAFHCLKITT